MGHENIHTKMCVFTVPDAHNAYMLPCRLSQAKTTKDIHTNKVCNNPPPIDTTHPTKTPPSKNSACMHSVQKFDLLLLAEDSHAPMKEKRRNHNNKTTHTQNNPMRNGHSPTRTSTRLGKRLGSKSFVSSVSKG